MTGWMLFLLIVLLLLTVLFFLVPSRVVVRGEIVHSVTGVANAAITAGTEATTTLINFGSHAIEGVLSPFTQTLQWVAKAAGVFNDVFGGIGNVGNWLTNKFTDTIQTAAKETGRQIQHFATDKLPNIAKDAAREITRGVAVPICKIYRLPVVPHIDDVAHFCDSYDL